MRKLEKREKIKIKSQNNFILDKKCEKKAKEDCL